ncbi:urease accessory protein UreH domain-containing protein [Parasporobacterium paucivorans]|uniref:Sulfite exporter TauE/SafE n=1 Tax=Parasporobacterium paucivorans DSM 15970 TaxID=1122934 RepID=A0A1M6E0Y7_9FIRM|nr:sulfite exporter TauE/SafE family protein [Parasporobacterium paucivorans]SHI79184.1 Sulfite exporter TauE/SafE [Parasporobacterium paucivorans DSM 15970]
MKGNIKRIKIHIGGMTCASCQNKIERKLRNAAGVTEAKVSYSDGTADVAYDPEIISLKDINEIIEKLDYTVLSGNKKREHNTGRVIGILLIIISLYMLLQQSGILNLLVPSQLADSKMGYGMLFVIGLITSIHCIAMCGGINLSQCIPRGDVTEDEKSRFSTFGPAFLYNFGRVISYTVIGFLLGFVGLLLGGGTDAGLPTMLQGILKLAAGIFMVITGINMLGIFPWLRRLQPRMPETFARKIGMQKSKSKSPLVVGLLNGLMPCGPLQSMQIVALASGNPFTGALSMLLFSLGTLPLMLGLGTIVSALGKKFTRKVMVVGAVLVVVLGLAMFSQGGSLSGLFQSGIASNVVSGSSSGGENIQVVDGEQVVNSTLSSGQYPNITVQAGIPVKWVIDAPKGSINGCNNKMIIRDFGIECSLKTGKNVIEFTPTETGNIRYSCWMGMIRGNITVTESGSTPDTSVNSDSTTGPAPAGYTIPTDTVAAAVKSTDEQGLEMQEVTIELTDTGFSPAVVIVQANLEVKWNIVNKSSKAGEGVQLLVPTYGSQVDLLEGENPLYFYPDVSFDFSDGESAFYGYVKVVDDISTADIPAIKAEAGQFETLIWPPDTFIAADSGASCH